MPIMTTEEQIRYALARAHDAGRTLRDPVIADLLAMAYDIQGKGAMQARGRFRSALNAFIDGGLADAPDSPTEADKPDEASAGDAPDTADSAPVGNPLRNTASDPDTDARYDDDPHAPRASDRAAYDAPPPADGDNTPSSESGAPGRGSGASMGADSTLDIPPALDRRDPALDRRDNAATPAGTGTTMADLTDEGSPDEADSDGDDDDPLG